MDEEELERLAAEELLREAKQGAARASVHGALGWKKDNAPRPNKRFLTTTLANTMQYNHRRSRSRSASPHHKYNHRSREKNPSRDSPHKEKRHHGSREEDHRSDRMHRQNSSSKRGKIDSEHNSRKHGKEEEREERRPSKTKRSRSHY